MQERHHVKTVPGEPKAPEVLKDGTMGEAVHTDESGHAQADDIDVGQVAVIVAFCVVTLAVVIIALQGMFYRLDEAELARKTAPQGGPGTELGAMMEQHHKQLANIEQAMELTVTDYAPGGARRK